MKVPFYDVNGDAKGDREYAIVEFEGGRGLQVLKEVILAYRANARQGNACTKTRGDVQGSGKKPFRQKGTGMARQGEKRSPLARGGGVVFGPKPRDFSVRLNHKEKRLALQRALFDAVREEKLVVLEALRSPVVPKTAEMAAVLSKIAVGSCLLLDSEFSRNQLLSLRNLKRVSSMDITSVNALDVSLHSRVVVTDRALSMFLEKMRAEG